MKLLKETKIWNTLFDYQQNGVISLVKLINRYNGAILADAVGLGKTFTALGVIRYFQNCGYDTLLLCPKKLGGNWEQYKHTHDSFLKDDHFEYIVRYHTDLQDNRMDKMDCTLQEIQKHQQLLLVIDESHNLRTHSSSRYKKLMEDIITYQNGRTRDVKVLLLSATPINNQLKDVRNQFNLIAGNYENSNEDAFNADFGIQSITNTFTHASKVYADWCERPNRTINTFREQLNDESFFNLTGKLIVARTRHFIQDKLGRDMHFPVKLPTKAICEGLNNIGHFKSIEEIYDKIKLLQLTAYQPTQYMYELPEPTREIVEEVKTLLDKIPGSHATLTIEHLIGKKDGKNIFTKYETVTYKVLPGMEPGFVDRLKDYVYDRWDGDIDLLPYSINTFAVKEAVRAAQEHDPELWQNNAYREMSLAAMMVVLFMKRLESSWDSCRSTANAVLKQHINWMKLAVANKDANAEGDSIDINIEDFTDDDVEEMIDGQATIGKRTVDFSKMLRYNDYLKALKQDIEILKDFVGALDDFGKAIAAGRQKDEKIEARIKELEEKQQKANKKVVIFTTYSDTAKYIYDCIKHSGKFRGYACVTGSATYINGETNDAGHDVEHKEFMHCLECFAPYTKLFMEKYWDDLFAKYNITSKNLETFQTWKAHVSEYDPRIAAQPNKEIDILIATDCLSEGQNLQDADTVINYDIHWNPVRLVQRYGRVDRIGSPNNEIQCVNFWPTASYENYLNLSKRITNRMLCMTIGGAEIIDDVNEKVKEMNADSKIRAQQEENALNAFNNNTYEELGESDGLDMANISLSEFKDDIVEFLSEQGDKFRKMPNGCFSGFRLNLDCYKDNITSDSIIAFVRNRVDTKKYHLLCLPVDGTPIAQEMSTEKILSVLKDTRHEDTLIETLQSFTADDFKNFSKTILKWFGSGTEYEIGDAVDKLLGDLKIEGPEQSIDEVLSPDNYDLIAWDYVKVDYNE